MVLMTEMADFLSATIQGVSTIGFPALMCIIILRYMQENDNKNREQVKELAKALENNSLVVTKLRERIDKLSERIGDNN